MERDNNIIEQDSAKRTKKETGVLLLALGLSLVGLAGTLAFPHHWLIYVFGHIGGIGSLGLLACLAGFIAKKKGGNSRTAFVVSFVSSIGLGVLSVCIVYALGGRGCGGIVSYAVGLLLIGWYAITRQRAVEILEE